MAKIRFAGSHIKVNKRMLDAVLKAGIDFYPDESDKCYAVQYVEKPIIPEGGYPGQVDDKGQPLDKVAYLAWLESLSTQMVLNSAFTHFIRIDANTTLPKLEAEIQRIFTPDVLTSADRFLAERGKLEREGFSKCRKMMAARERLGNGLVLPKGYNAEGLITETNNRFKGLGGELDGEGKILDVKPDTIDVGAAAIDREAGWGIEDHTIVAQANPANASGEITSNAIWLAEKTAATNIFIGAFYGNPVLTVRDSESIGDIAVGSKRTQFGLTINIESGDYWGCHDKSGAASTRIECDSTPNGGGAGHWWFLGECIDPSDSESFSTRADQDFSLYGEGEAAGWTGKISGVTNPAKVMGVDFFNIAEVKGVVSA